MSLRRVTPIVENLGLANAGRTLATMRFLGSRTPGDAGLCGSLYHEDERAIEQRALLSVGLVRSCSQKASYEIFAEAAPPPLTDW